MPSQPYKEGLLMEHYTTTHRNILYVAEIAEGVYGGYNLVITKTRTSGKSKVCYTQHCNSHFDAMIEMDEYLSDAKWEAKNE